MVVEGIGKEITMKHGEGISKWSKWAGIIGLLAVFLLASAVPGYTWRGGRGWGGGGHGWRGGHGWHGGGHGWGGGRGWERSPCQRRDGVGPFWGPGWGWGPG